MLTVVTVTTLHPSPRRQVHIEGFSGVVKLGGHGGGDGGDVPVTQGSALDIHAFRRHNLHC